MPVSDHTPYFNVAASGGNTYPFNFKIHQAEELLVKVAGVTKTLGLDYAVTITAEPGEGGSIIFQPGYIPAIGSGAVEGERVVVTERITDYQEEGGFRQAVVDKDFDRLNMMVQDLKRMAQRAIKLPSSSFGDFVLPEGSFTDMVLGFGADGAPIPMAPPALLYSPNGPWVDAKQYVTLAEADAAAVAAGKLLVISTVWGVVPAALTANIKIIPGGQLAGNGTVAISGEFEGCADCFGLNQVVTGLKLSRPEWFSGGLPSAIASLAAGGSLKFKGGVYPLTTGVSAALTGKQVWIAEGDTTIQYSGAEITYMVLLTLNSNDLTMKGPLTFDANLKARCALRVNNSVANMSLAASVTMDGVYGINAYSTDTVGHTGSNGILIYGGYKKVYLTRCGAINVSRAAGVGLSGSQGSGGVTVTGTVMTSYPKEVVVIDPYIDSVISEEADGAANNLDCDGLAVFGPNATANGGKRVDTSFTVRGGRFRNCRGRSIKSQMESNMVDGPTFIRDSTSLRSITVGMEVDFQYGSGTLKNWRCNYSPLVDGSTPFGDSFVIVQATARNYTSISADGEGDVKVESGEIINNVPYATDAIPYVLSLTSTQTGGVNGKFANVSVKGLTFLGEGGINGLVYGDVGFVRQLNTSDNYIYKLGVALVYTTANADGCKWTALNNVIPNSSGATLWKAFTGNPPTLIQCGNNPNFNGAATYDLGESVSLVDDASYVFANHGATTMGIYAIKNNFNQTSQALFIFHSTIIDLGGGLTTTVAYGNGVNPDTDGKLNVWRDANGRVNIKNRLGSTRIFTLNAL